MFGSGSSGKSSVKTDGPFSGRGNARCPVGVTTSGDENHQVRIQLAVHKYNSFPNGSKNLRRSLASPGRVSLLKNSLRGRNCEVDGESGNGKGDKKKVEPYDQVGAFPTIHLRKNPVLYRPFRRFDEVKVPCPDLPVNRFLSHLPEFSCQLKKNTRSVIEVLQDLSRKKINSKEEPYFNSDRRKGLAGDFDVEADAVYKPLFVPKPKINSITTRDNTTQTLLSPGLDLSKTPKTNSTIDFINHETCDPKAELRKKLALQNNEIFASLSSSITSAFPSKRKLDKELPSRDSECSNGLPLKKAKVFEHVQSSSRLKSSSQSPTMVSPLKEPPFHPKRKVKPCESTSKSPNKDRLTTIYLEFQSAGSKAGIFSSSNNALEKKVASPSEEKKERTSLAGKADHKIEDDNGKSAQDFRSSSNNSKEVSAFTKNNFESGSDLSVRPGNAGQNGGNGKADYCSPLDKSLCLNSSFSLKLPSKPFCPTLSRPVSKEDSSEKSKSETVLGKTQEHVADELVGKDHVTSPKSVESSSKLLTENTQISKKENNSEMYEGAFRCGGADNGLTNILPQISNGFAGPNVSSAAPRTQSIAFPHVDVPKVTSSSFNFGNYNSSCFALTNLKKGEKNLEFSDRNSISPGVPEPRNSVNAPSNESDGTGSKAFLFGSDPSKNESLEVKNKDAKKNGQCGEGSSSQCQGVSPENQNPDGSTSSFAQNPAQPSSAFDAAEIPEKVPVFCAAEKSFSQNVFNAFSNSNADALKQGRPNFSPVFGQPPDNKPTTDAVDLSENQSTNSKTGTLFSFSQTASTGETCKSPSTTISDRSGFAQNSSAKSTDAFGNSGINQSVLFGQSSASSISVQSAGSAPNVCQSPNPVPDTKNLLESKSEVTTFGKISVTPSFQLSNSPFSSKANSFVSPKNESVSVFGASTSSDCFGVPVSRPGPSFSVCKTSTSAGLGIPISTQSNSAFENAAFTQANNSFGNPSTNLSSASPSSTLFGFGAASSSQPNPQFVTPSISSFGASTSSSQTFNRNAEKLSDVSNHTLGVFSRTSPQNSTTDSSFSISSPQSTLFGQKTDGTPGNTFDQNKIQGPAFGRSPPSQASPFGTTNKFAFGVPSSTSVACSGLQPGTTSGPVFNFGGTAQSPSNGFGFGGISESSTSSASAQSPFAFKGTTTETFKFGGSPAKESPSFGSSNSALGFGFGAQGNNNVPEANSTGTPFNFGGTQVTSASVFNFGSTPSPAVFNFGSSSSNTVSGSTLNFGNSQNFGQPSTSSPTPFSAPGTFSIGWGSSQSRPKAASRLRRRP